MDVRTLLRSYRRREWASAVEPSRPARSLPTGPSFSRASWSPAIEVSWRSLWRSSAPSHMHEFPFRTNESAVSPSFSSKLPSRICGVNLRMEKYRCNRGAAARRGLLDAPVRFRLTCFKQRASRLYSWPSFGESPCRQCKRMLPTR